jgi:phage-related protein
MKLAKKPSAEVLICSHSTHELKARSFLRADYNVSVAWDIFFYENPRGEKVVREFLESEGELLMAKAVGKISLLQEYGPFLGMPHARKIGGKLYELRIRGKDEVRILYAFVQNKICLLNAFRKKTMEIPEKELETAANRLKTLT